jgi:hypothetical protein
MWGISPIAVNIAAAAAALITEVMLADQPAGGVR